MKIFLGGAVSVASQEQLEKYNIYKGILSGFGSLTVPDDIWNFRQKCIENNPGIEKVQIDKMMVDYDLELVKNADLMVCDISEQSTGLGLELGVALENKIALLFCYQKGSYISNMLTGAFNKSAMIEYDSTEDLSQKLSQILKEKYQRNEA